MATSDILLSQTQCITVVKVQVAQLSDVVNPKTIKDANKLETIGIEDKKGLERLKQRITKVVVIEEHMDADTFFESLAFTTKSSVFTAGRSVFKAQTRAWKPS